MGHGPWRASVSGLIEMASSFDPFQSNPAFDMLAGLFQASLMTPRELPVKENSLPLTIVSGFLGAGKTTLVNSLLTGNHGRKLAVLVNDFGSINIDYELVRSQSAETINLANGCACCTVAGDLTRTLVSLMERTERPDAIVLEASGLADPWGIAQVSLANPALYLDGILSFVDAGAFLDQIDDANVAAIMRAQLTAADLIVVNKLDLLNEADRIVRKDQIFSRIREIVPGRPILAAEYANVPVEVVLGISSSRSHALQCSTEPGHAATFESSSHSWNTVFDRQRLSRALAQLPASIIRAKGLFYCNEGQDRRYVYQKVGKRSSLVLETNGDVAQQHVSKFVAIAPAADLDSTQIGSMFDDCIAAKPRAEIS